MRQTTYICDITKTENLSKDEIITLRLFRSSKLNPNIHNDEKIKYDEQFDEYDLSLKGAEKLISYVITQLHAYDEKMYSEISSYLKKSRENKSAEFIPIRGEIKE